MMITRGYFDIETTGLSRNYCELTVVGIGLEQGRKREFCQLVGEQVSAWRLVRLTRKADVLYTYNGARFDLPFVKARLGVDLKDYTVHKDLMYECWRRNLYGGLKKVESALGITRKTQGINGWMAVKLWYDYLNHGNMNSLALLLDYNKEDVWNLRVLRKKLNV